MNKKQLFSIGLVALLGGSIVYVNRDWFRHDRIQISHRCRSFAGRMGGGSGGAEVFFEFSRTMKLTSLEVVPVQTSETNKTAQPTWHLISDSNSVPTKGILYGMEVPGMRPAYKGVEADPLEPGGRYRLVVQAGSTRAEHEFDLESSP